MLHVDDTRWPLATVCMSGSLTTEDVARHARTLSDWLERGETFVMLSDLRAADAPPDPDAARALVAFGSTHRERIARLCAGMAAVADPETVAQGASTADERTRTVYGCPGAIFASTAAAEVWLRDRLAAPAASASKGVEPGGQPTFGLLLNAGAQLGATHDAVFDLLLEEARLADELGYHDLWVTEHHFIPFGINSSALALAAFLLGRTRRVRVGTAVCLTTHLHPLQVAEQAAILDQASDGRFDLGIGRGGYLQEYDAFGTDLARWDDEVEATATVLLDAWTKERVASAQRWFPFPPTPLVPRPRTRPHPPLFLGTVTSASVALAARARLGLLHYFATPVEARIAVEASYAEAARTSGSTPSDVAHVHALIVVVADDELEARAALATNLAASFRDGDWPHVPQAAGRHATPDGKPVDRAVLAAHVAQQAIVGPPEAVTAQLRAFRAATGASRLVLYMEPIVERARLLSTIERFAREVAPALRE